MEKPNNPFRDSNETYAMRLEDIARQLVAVRRDNPVAQLPEVRIKIHGVPDSAIQMADNYIRLPLEVRFRAMVEGWSALKITGELTSRNLL